MIVKAVRSPRVVAARAVGDESIARAVRVAVQQLVLRESQARVDVDEAVDADDPRVGGEAPRVVDERGEVGGGRGRPGRPDGQADRRELALAELASRAVEGGPRRDRGREDLEIRGVEPDVQERRAEDSRRSRASGRGRRPAGA